MTTMELLRTAPSTIVLDAPSVKYVVELAELKTEFHEFRSNHDKNALEWKFMIDDNFKKFDSNKIKKFNMVINRSEANGNGDSNYPIGVIIKDWTRSIGVNSVIKAEHDAEDAGLNTVIVVGNQFSLQARGMANRMGIRLISRGELVVGYHQDPAVF